MKEIRKKKEVNYPYIPQLLHEGFCESVKKYPSKIALCSNGKEYTYKELGEYATSVKKELLRKNIKTADIVAIELKKGIWQIASVLGVLLAGGTYLPVDIGQPRNRKNKIELDAQAKFIITSNKNIDLLDCAEKIYVEDMVVADALEVEVLNTNTNQAAYIIYTSGTTGNPKGVVISHASAMNTINDVIRRYNITKNDSVLGISNLAFDLSVFDIFGIFAVGGKLVLPTDEKNVSEWGTLLLENQITIWNSVPAQMQMLLSYLEAEKKRKVEKLRLIMLSGDWIPVQLPKRMKQIFGNSRMISLGGATEASIWSIAYEINPDYVYEKSIPYGIPLSNQKFYILDDEMRECPDWVKGRIYISGKGLALGYFKDDSLTCRKFVFHKELEERLYDTGDMGRYRTDGVIEFLGREDYQVKIRGHRVELNEVESVINQCEDVEGSIVVTATENDDIIGAFVQPKIEKSVVDNTAEINDIKNKNKSFNQDSNLFEANVLDFADWLHASNETAIYDMLATFYKVEIFTDRNTWYPIKEIFNSLGQFKEIAAPNGNLIIIDATGNNYALMTSIEFLNGLNGVEDFRAENEQIFLQQDQWNKLFKKSDIELLAAFPEEDSTLKVIGQTVFVCKFNSKRRRIDPSEIKNYMANNLPEYMLPSHIEVLKEFPLTANGKIDRNILRNHLDGTLTQTTEQGEAPSTDLEKAIAQIWCDALKKEKIWKNENFYEIGGDSLLVAQVVAKMKEKIEEAKAWDWDKLMIALIESPTIEGISKKLMEGLPSEETKEKQESLIILKQGNNNKALVLIHDGTGTISPYNQVIPFLHSTEGSLLALQCNDMEEYLSVKPEKLIQFLGEKYAKILIDTEKEVYDLVGYCMGGLIALETAKILTEAGKTVHSLISVDTTPSRRMVNNELLMERAFGMIIGADTYKVGHTVEDELLKRAIKELGEKYGDNVSNEELVSLEGEFLPVSQCYGKLIKKTHAERLLELYNTLPATKGETSGYSKERLDTLYKVFCHSFSAVIMYDAGIYVGNALVLSCRNKNSSFLPVEPTDNERFWKEATVGNITSELIEGEHLTCMTGSYADKVAERILKEERL